MSGTKGSTDDDNYENNKNNENNTDDLEDEEPIEEALIQIRAPRMTKCRIRGANYRRSFINHFFSFFPSKTENNNTSFLLHVGADMVDQRCFFVCMKKLVDEVELSQGMEAS